MEFQEVVDGRRMVRSFDPDRPVPRADLDRILRNAARSPSAGHSQGWDLVVLTGSRDRVDFWACASPGRDDAAAPNPWLAGVSAAPVLILCCVDPGAYRRRYAAPDKQARPSDQDPDRWPVPWWDVDSGMAAMSMLLTARDAGLGALWFGLPADPEVREAVRDRFGIPEGHRLIGMLALGYPRADAGPGARATAPGRPKRPWRRVAHQGRFGRVWGSDPVSG